MSDNLQFKKKTGWPANCSSVKAASSLRLMTFCILIIQYAVLFSTLGTFLLHVSIITIINTKLNKISHS